MIIDTLYSLLIKNGLLTAFVLVGLTMWLSNWVSSKLTRGYVHGSAIAIAAGLLFAYMGGKVSGGQQGLADIELFAGIGIMGGAMFRDFAIVATAFGAGLHDLRPGWSLRMHCISWRAPRSRGPSSSSLIGGDGRTTPRSGRSAERTRPPTEDQTCRA